MEMTLEARNIKNKTTREYYNNHKQQQKAYNRKYWVNKLLKELTK